MKITIIIDNEDKNPKTENKVSLFYWCYFLVDKKGRNKMIYSRIGLGPGVYKSFFLKKNGNLLNVGAMKKLYYQMIQSRNYLI